MNNRTDAIHARQSADSPEQVDQLSGCLKTWDSVSVDDKRRMMDLMITTIAATSDSLNIQGNALMGGTSHQSITLYISL